MSYTDNKISIIRGEDRTLQLGINESNGTPYDLTGYTEIVIELENEDGSWLDLKYTDSEISVVEAKAGTIAVTITDTQSALLMIGNAMSFQCKITIGGLVRTALFDGLLSVIEEIGA